MFWTRLFSGIGLVLLALFTIISGGTILFATLVLISLIGLSELYKVFGIANKSLGIVGYFAGLTFYIFLYTMNQEKFLMLFIAYLIVLMVFYVFSFPKYNAIHVIAAFFGLFYVEIMLSFVYQARMLENGIYLVWLIFICSWGCDTFAYCVGMLIGKHKLAPKLSPKKSIEGAIGGILGAALLGALYGLIIKNYLQGAENIILSFAVICGIGGAISQVGDLAASAIKRNYDIKDYGNLIPGHGGILDRFDSVIFTAPIIYYLAVYLIK